MMLGTGATCETLTAAICITPFRAWRDRPLPFAARLNDDPNHARQRDSASTTFSALAKSELGKLVNYSRSWRQREQAAVCPASSNAARLRRPRQSAREATREARKPGRGTRTAKARLAAKGLIQPNIHIVTRDPLRVQILSTAMVRAISAVEFAVEVNIPYSTATYHFRVLREAGFLELVEEENVKGAAKRKLYRATRNGFISDAEWGDVEDKLRPGVAGAILQDFNGRTSESIETGKMFTREDATLYWVPRLYDLQAWEELMDGVRWMIDFQNELQEQAIQRRADGISADEDCMTATFAIAAYPSPTPDEVSGAQRKGKRDGGTSLRKSRGKGKRN